MSSDYERYCITIKKIENGYTVDVPDWQEIAKKQAQSKKNAGKNDSACCPTYIGDCTETFAAKSVKEVMKIVQTAVNQIPEDTADKAYDSAFAEAAGVAGSMKKK